MHIGVIGATGNVGRRVAAEAARRGHHVTGFTRDASRPHPEVPVATWKSIDVLDAESATAAIGGLDVLVSAYGPGNAGQDFDDTMRRSIDDPSTFARVATTLLKGLDDHPSIRLIVIGGGCRGVERSAACGSVY